MLTQTAILFLILTRLDWLLMREEKMTILLLRCLINQDLSGKPIYEVIERYYSGDVTSRCTQFYDKRFNSDKATVKNEATKYLKKSMMTETFRDVFGSNYDYKYVDRIFIFFKLIWSVLICEQNS